MDSMGRAPVVNGRRTRHALFALAIVLLAAAFVVVAAPGAGKAQAAAYVRQGVDYSSSGNVDWPTYFKALKADGRDFIGRYLPTGVAWRDVTPVELQAATNAGVDFFFWFETGADRALDGFDAGAADATTAVAALAALGQPTTTPVYYTVDFNLSDGAKIDAYFRGIASVVPLSQIGIYGDYDALDWATQHGLATYFCQCAGWLDSRGWHPSAIMHQTAGAYSVGGINADRLTVTASDFGQCRRHQQNEYRISYSGSWSTYTATGASGGNYTRSSTTGASATIYFTGTSLDWIAQKGTTTGIADVYVDGVKKATVNLAASSATYGVKVWSSGTLIDGPHKVQIVRSASSASGKFITVDALDVVGGMNYGPPGIASLAPKSGPTAGDTSVTINGTNFMNVTGVTFGGAPAVSYTILSSQQIVARAPAHAAGAVQVQVIASAGNTANTTADDYTYTDTAALARFEQTDPHILYSGAWEAYAKTSASGGSYGRSATAGASATIYFTGTRLDWIATKGTHGRQGRRVP